MAFANKNWRGSGSGDLFPYDSGHAIKSPHIKRAAPDPLVKSYPSAFEERNESFFEGDQRCGDNAIIAAFEHCAQVGYLNLAGQGMEGELEESIILSFAQSSWHENWWEQHPVRKVDVSHNELTSIPPAIAQLADVESFLAMSNKLTSIPKEMLTAMPKLRELNLRHNLLRSIRGSLVAHAERLLHLVVSGNRLTKLPQELFCLFNIETIEAADNEIGSFPDGPWCCQSLRRLDVSNNVIGDVLPATLREAVGLEELDVSHNHLTEVGDVFRVPPEHNWSKTLIFLDFSHNSIGPDLTLDNLCSLDFLQASCNFLSAINLTNITSLSVLIAANNKLTEFPTVSPKFATVDLTNNSISHLPSALGFVKSLKRAIFTGNPLLGIRPELHNGNTEALKNVLRKRKEDPEEEDKEVSAEKERHRQLLAAALRTGQTTGYLDLAGWSFKTLPQLPPHLQRLDVSGNPLTSKVLLDAMFLPSGEAKDPVASLKILQASGNLLGKGESSRGLLRILLQGLLKLQEVDLERNSLTDSCIGFDQADLSSCTFAEVKRLGLNYNNLVEFPISLIRAVPTLRRLQVSFNKIESVATLHLVAGASLQELGLSENLLSDLPGWLPQALPRLTSLDVSNNQIIQIPFELGFWRSLQEFSIIGNPQKLIRQGLLAKGWEGISTWLQDRLPAGSCRIVPLPGETLPDDSDDELWVPLQSRRPARIRPTTRKSDRPPPGPPPALVYRPGSSSGVSWPWPNEFYVDKDAEEEESADAATPRGRRERKPIMGSPFQTEDTSGKKQDSLSRRSTFATDPHLVGLRAQVLALQADCMDESTSRSERSTLAHRLRMKKVELRNAEANFKEEVIVQQEKAMRMNSPVARHPGEVTWATLPAQVSIARVR